MQKNAGRNKLSGGAGNDLINGGLGNDVLIGGAGNDAFIFNSALGPTNIDAISDFVIVNDTMRLENAIFTSLSITGTLAAAALRRIRPGWPATAATASSTKLIRASSTMTPTAMPLAAAFILLR